jgi:oxygen-independent coproporphyrinogen-3 oxidase
VLKLGDDPKNRKQEYAEALELEIERLQASVPFKLASSIYFGGGTPSLMGPALILRVLQGLEKAKFQRTSDCEITLEINPGTINAAELNDYLKIGINRFSVGVQTFDSAQLKRLGRLHSVEEARQTLDLMKSNNVNFSMDLMFALPGQSVEQLQADLDIIKDLKPPHVSGYVLTLDEGHKLDVNRPDSEQQAYMFRLVRDQLASVGMERYETSNYAQTGFRSRHNQLYWGDHPYWGIGMSAHSYFPNEGPHGTRFSNPRLIQEYSKFVENLPSTKANFISSRPGELVERLQLHEALTDFCHISLRRSDGLYFDAAMKKFGPHWASIIHDKVVQLQNQGLVLCNESKAWVTDAGWLLNDTVFRHLTFLESELQAGLSTDTQPN